MKWYRLVHILSKHFQKKCFLTEKYLGKWSWYQRHDGQHRRPHTDINRQQAGLCVCLLDDTAAACWVICDDLVLVAEDDVDVRVAFPFIVHLSDGDQLDCLSLRVRESNVEGIVSTFLEIHLFSFFLSLRRLGG